MLTLDLGNISSDNEETGGRTTEKARKTQGDYCNNGKLFLRNENIKLQLVNVVQPSRRLKIGAPAV